MHASILSDMGAYPEAQADIMKILRRFRPQDPDYECQLAEIRFQAGEKEQSLKLMRALLRRNPEHGTAWRQRGVYEEAHAQQYLAEACQTASETLLTTEAERTVALLHEIAARDHSDPERVSLLTEVRETFLPRFEQPLLTVLDKVDLASTHFTNARYSLASSFAERFDTDAVNSFLRLNRAAGREDLAADFGVATLNHPDLAGDYRILATLFETLESVGRTEQLHRLLLGIDWQRIDGDLDFFVDGCRALYQAGEWKILAQGGVPRMTRLGGPIETSYMNFYAGMAMAGVRNGEQAQRRLEPYLKQRVSHEPVPGALGTAGLTLARILREQGSPQERWALERAVLYSPYADPEAYLRLVELQLRDKNISFGIPEDRWTRAMSLMPERTEELMPRWAELGSQALTARGRDLETIMKRLRESGASIPATDTGPWALFRLGEMHLEEERPLGAMKVAKELLERYPGLLPALDLAIESHLDRNQIAPAAELILERLVAVGRDLKTTEYLAALGENPFEEQQMLEMMLADPTRTGRLTLARHLLDSGDADRALRALQRETVTAPIPEARLATAEALYELRRYDEAVEILRGLVDDPQLGGQAAVRLMLALFGAKDRDGLTAVVEEHLATAATSPQSVLEVIDLFLATGREGLADLILAKLDDEPETRSGEVLWRMALSAALQDDVLGALEALERAQAYLPDGRVELARLVFAIDSRDWTALPELVAELRETRYKPSPLTNTILTVLEERLDAASAMAESGMQQNPHSPDWAIVLAADRLLDGRPFELPSYFGPDIIEPTTRLLRGYGEIARDPRELLGFMLATDLPNWEIWCYKRTTRREDEVGDEPWSTFLRSRTLQDLGRVEAAEKGFKFLTLRHRQFGPAWDVYEAMRRAAYPGDRWAPEVVELRQLRLQSLGEEASGTPLEVQVDRAATQAAIGRYASARGILRAALEEAGPDAVHGRDLLARCYAELGDLSEASSDYLRACEALPGGTDHGMVAEFIAFLEQPGRPGRELEPEEIDFALERLYQRFPHDPLVSLTQARRLLLEDDGPELTMGFASNRLRALRDRAGSRPLDSLRAGSALAWTRFLLQFSPEQAEALVREELVLTPGNLELWLALAECIRARGRTDDALDVYRRLVEMSDDHQAHLALAWMLADGGAPPSEIQTHLRASVREGAAPSARTTFIRLRSNVQSPETSISVTIKALTDLWNKREEIADEVPLNELGMTLAGALILRGTRADEAQLYGVIEQLADASTDTYERDVLRGMGSLASIVAEVRARQARQAKEAAKARKGKRQQNARAEGEDTPAPQPEESPAQEE